MKGLFIMDTEADDLVEGMTKFHCLLFKEYMKDNFHLFLDKSHPEALSAAEFAAKKETKNLTVHDFSEFNTWIVTDPKAIACHNIFGYDMRALKKMFGTTYDMFEDKECRGTINGHRVDMYDTLSMSRTLYPDRPLPHNCPVSVKNPVTGKNKLIGPHGLEAWGVRVANLKVSIDDWRNLPLWQYVDRVWEDVLINEMVWTALMKEATCMDNPDDLRYVYKDTAGGIKMINWKNALRRGMLTDYLMVEQEIQGVVFNVEKARELLIIIDRMMKEIEDEVEPQLPKKELSKSAQPNFPVKPFANGEISHHGWNWLEYKLGYPVNREALNHVEPPATAFKADGNLSVAGKNYCIKHGVEDEALMPDFIRSQINKATLLKPLPDELLEQAKQDLRDEKMPDITVPMRISNQDDIKKFLIRDAGWLPTLWRTKDATKDQFKKTRSKTEVEEIVNLYVDQLYESEYKSLVIKYLNLSDDKFKISERTFDMIKTHQPTREKVVAKFIRKARQLPTSPQLRDTVTKQLCTNLDRVEGAMAKLIVKWLSARNRRSVLDPIDEDKNDTGWLNHPRLLIDGKLPARYSGITNTGRRKHQVVANLPKPDPKVLLGKEMRSLFTVPEGCYQVGIDGSNLEGMIAAWGAYEFDGGAYLRIMESEDAHARNAKAYSEACGRKIGRGEGKGVTYGIMYGAQAAKIAAMLNITLLQAQAVIDAFWDNNLGLKGRKEALENFWESNGKRFIYGLDGRKIWTRSKHSLLNAYQQNGGASLFDLVGILFHWAIKKNGMYDEGVRRTIYYHDEYQIQVPNKFKKLYEFDNLTDADEFVKSMEAKGHHVDGHPRTKKEDDGSITEIRNANGKFEVIYCPVGEIVVKCIEKAARMMNSPVHITGAYLTGDSWAACH